MKKSVLSMLLAVAVIAGIVRGQGITRVSGGINEGRRVGEIILSTEARMPSGWLLCTGSWVKTSDFPRLYRATRGRWGVRMRNGQREFKLPYYGQMIDNQFVWGAIAYEGRQAFWRTPIK